MTNASPDWDRVVERHAERVFRTSLRILRTVQDAEDVSQDVFIEAFRLHKAGPVQVGPDCSYAWRLCARSTTFAALGRR
jgi:hypothetical protein